MVVEITQMLTALKKEIYCVVYYNFRHNFVPCPCLFVTSSGTIDYDDDYNSSDKSITVPAFNPATLYLLIFRSF